MMYDYWIIGGPWLLWVFYWFFSALSARRTKQAEPVASRLLHLVLFILSFVLVAWPGLAGAAGWPLIPDRLLALILGVCIEVLGLGLTVWARVYLGQYWSGTIGIKVGHKLIFGGPYALVRHPIYTGIVLAFLGAALAADRMIGLLALALFIFAYVRKILIEEKWLVRQFKEEYTGYQRNTRAFIPFIW